MCTLYSNAVEIHICMRWITKDHPNNTKNDYILLFMDVIFMANIHILHLLRTYKLARAWYFVCEVEYLHYFEYSFFIIALIIESVAIKLAIISVAAFPFNYNILFFLLCRVFANIVIRVTEYI